MMGKVWIVGRPTVRKPARIVYHPKSSEGEDGELDFNKASNFLFRRLGAFFIQENNYGTHSKTRIGSSIYWRW